MQRLGRDLPSLRGDKVQLGQVLMNLVANAVDAIEDGAGTVEVSTGLVEVDDSMLQASFFAEEREPGAYLFLRVKDTGIGMSPEQVERIFDPFYSDKRSGKGLGLSSLSGIVRQHRGFVRLSSSPGEGTDFTIFFPVLSVSDTDRETAIVTTARDRAKGQVLVADDDPRIRSLMASILESDHYIIVSAEDGKDALTRWREHHGDFDLLVLDCTMPKMSGTEVYRQLRSEGVTTPVVLVSGFHQEQVVRNIESDPCGRFVKKPFNVDSFLSEVDEALKQSRVTR
ncbi:MAG: response regulator [Gammaproteobacteria bacterium]|nr:response regulator [Gammaproteobacteria bacterium]